MNMQRFGAAAAAAVALLIGASCEQGSIFHDISNETKKASADVKGTPTRMVSFGGSLYVANGHLYQRGAPGDWSKVSVPDGRSVRDIDTDGAYLYALTVSDDDQVSSSSTETRVYRTTDPNDGDGWERLYLADEVSSYKYLYKLSAAAGTLYVGGRANDGSASYDVAFAILKANGTTLEGVVADLDYRGEFAGAASDGTDTYLATADAGIFTSADSFAAALSGTEDSDYALKGIYSTSGGSTIALGWNGDVFAKIDGGDAFTASTENYKFTGAIAEYDADGDGVGELLLAGIKSGTVYGYREISLSSGALISTAPSANKPNNDDSSVKDYAQYAGSLGVVSLEQLYQDWSSGESILYASSYNDGLWSSTSRGDWNLDH